MPLYWFQWLIFGHNIPSIKLLSSNGRLKIHRSYCFPRYFVPVVNSSSLLKAQSLLLTGIHLALASSSFLCSSAQDETLLPSISTSIKDLLVHRKDISDPHNLLIKLNGLSSQVFQIRKTVSPKSHCNTGMEMQCILEKTKKKKITLTFYVLVHWKTVIRTWDSESTAWISLLWSCYSSVWAARASMTFGYMSIWSLNSNRGTSIPASVKNTLGVDSRTECRWMWNTVDFHAGAQSKFKWQVLQYEAYEKWHMG